MKLISAISCLFLAFEGLASTVVIGQEGTGTTATSSTTAADSTSTTTSTTTSTAKVDSCVTKLEFMGDTTLEPLQQFEKFIDECLTFELRVPNGVKVASCFHTGFFLMRTLRPMANQIAGGDDAAQSDFTTYIENFCESHAEILPKRTGFIQTISDIGEATDFTNACFEHLEATPTLNTWFDPIDAIASITQQEVCDLHFKLFESLRSKQRTSIAEFVSFSYLASLDLFLNAYQQEDYENCVNIDVIEQPNSWVTEFVSSHPALLIWSSQAKLDIAAEAGTDISTKCADNATCRASGSCEACDGCATGIARVYRTFELYLNTMFAEKFRDYSENMFNKLHEANLALETN